MTWIRSLTARERLLAAISALVVSIGAITAAAVTGGDGDTSLATAGSSTTLGPTASSTSSSTSSSSSSSSTSSSSSSSTSTSVGPGATTTTGRGGGGTGTTKAPTTTRPTTAPRCTLQPDAAYASQLAILFEAHRAQLGLPQMTRTTALDSVAAAWAKELACNHRTDLPHNPNGRRQVLAACETCNGWAENVAFDPGGATKMWEAWMSSPTHKANIENGRAGEYGLAVVEGSDGNHYAVHDFGRHP